MSFMSIFHIGSVFCFVPASFFLPSTFTDKNSYVYYSVPLLFAAPKVMHEKNWKTLDVLEHFHQQIHP